MEHLSSSEPSRVLRRSPSDPGWLRQALKRPHSRRRGCPLRVSSLVPSPQDEAYRVLAQRRRESRRGGIRTLLDRRSMDRVGFAHQSGQDAYLARHCPGVEPVQNDRRRRNAGRRRPAPHHRYALGSPVFLEARNRARLFSGVLCRGLLYVVRTDNAPRVRDGYISESTSGHARARATRHGAAICRTNMLLSDLDAVTAPGRGKEGVDGSSPSEGFRFSPAMSRFGWLGWRRLVGEVSTRSPHGGHRARQHWRGGRGG